ncbi:glycosyltransferase [Flavobacterium ranwuense]|uniref:Glycosyltransferase n=1 Tax=Flavobacterium ranwuense TaxID=2541725 RepID=A0ABY2DPF0_9FLAO|nr:glycosyltransferase family 4 protein [Flavobacterium ranwuense]TDE28044.1 glycosyltransferase [Flavobacterium ranwuense]
MVKSKIKNLVYFLYALFYFVFFILFDLKKIKKADIIFFFPYYHTGGAERVHLNIVKALCNKNICVIFTNNSATKNFRTQFYEHSNCIEINKILNKKNIFINAILKKILVRSINKAESVETIFGCNTHYFYEILSKINTSITRIDLFHAFSHSDSRETEVVESVCYIDKRIVINNSTKKDLLKIYNKYHVSSRFFNNVYIIQNGIDIISQRFAIKDFQKIKLAFVGRWSEEKRPEIFIEIAKQIISRHDSIEFIMVGTGMKSNIGNINDAGVNFLGEITNYNELEEVYNQLTFILITSEYEGFPMVIMEAMAKGVIPITTNVGGISEHIINNQNGILVSDGDKEKIVSDFINSIEKLLLSKEQMNVLSKNAYQYAHLNFQIKNFNDSYFKLLFKE